MVEKWFMQIANHYILLIPFILVISVPLLCEIFLERLSGFSRKFSNFKKTRKTKPRARFLAASSFQFEVLRYGWYEEESWLT